MKSTKSVKTRVILSRDTGLGFGKVNS